MSLSHSPAPKKVVSTIKKLDKHDLEQQNQMIDKLNLKKREIMDHDSLHTRLANEYKDAPVGHLPNTDFNALAHKMQTLLNDYSDIIEKSKSIVPFKIWNRHIHNHYAYQYPGPHGGGVKTKRRHRRVRRSRVRRSRVRRSRTRRSN